MKITRSAISLNVEDVEGSARFASDHLGFAQEMADEGFVSLTRKDAGFNLIFLRTGLGTFKPKRIAGAAGMGTLIVFVVDDIDAQYERLRTHGVKIVTPIETEPWGERFFQMQDPNGLVYQLVQWVS